uniref:Uncharacterized protein n=1 Tax=Arundo donax TaxID=35708 RepID=A0A0A9HKW7_ARUDO
MSEKRLADCLCQLNSGYLIVLHMLLELWGLSYAYYPKEM